MSLPDHMKRNKAPLLNPKRNPQAETDTHTTESAPKTSQHSGDGLSFPDSHAGAGGKGRS